MTKTYCEGCPCLLTIDQYQVYRCGLGCYVEDENSLLSSTQKILLFSKFCKLVEVITTDGKHFSPKKDT